VLKATKHQDDTVQRHPTGFSDSLPLRDRAKSL